MLLPSSLHSDSITTCCTIQRRCHCCHRRLIVAIGLVTVINLNAVLSGHGKYINAQIWEMCNSVIGCIWPNQPKTLETEQIASKDCWWHKFHQVRY